MANNNPFYPTPANPYTWNNTYTPGTSYAPQPGSYMAGNQTPNPYQNQQPNRFQSIPGRLVNNLDEITPQEVPMDGSVSLFPTNDFSAIYAKTWTKDGTIATVKYVPEQPQAAAPKSPIEERLDRIDQRFDRLEKMLSNRSKPKKPYNKPNQVKEEQNNV